MFAPVVADVVLVRYVLDDLGQHPGHLRDPRLPRSNLASSPLEPVEPSLIPLPLRLRGPKHRVVEGAVEVVALPLCVRYAAARLVEPGLEAITPCGILRGPAFVRILWCCA